MRRVIITDSRGLRRYTIERSKRGLQVWLKVERLSQPSGEALLVLRAAVTPDLARALGATFTAYAEPE